MRILALLLAVGAASGTAMADLRHDDGSTRPVYGATGPYQMFGGSGGNRGSTLVYDNSVQTGFRYNAGQAGANNVPPADARRTPYDDVPISNAILNGATALDVCRVTVGIRQLAGAPATDVSVFWSTLTTGTTLPDTELDLPSNLIGTTNIPGVTVAATTLVTFGATNGPTLFQVPLNSTLLSGFGTFAIGVNLSNPDGLNGWRLTNGPSANANIFWQHDPGLTGQANPEAAFLFSNTVPPNPLAAFYIIVEGNPVPTPGALALLGLGGLAVARRRRA